MTRWTPGCPPAKRKYPADFPDNPRASGCSTLWVRTSDGSKERIRSTGSIPAVIPGGLTKILQPLDISVNKCFKTEMMKLWETWMSDGEKSYTATGRMRRAYYQTVLVGEGCVVCFFSLHHHKSFHQGRDRWCSLARRRSSSTACRHRRRPASFPR